jgi:hypothetical protein
MASACEWVVCPRCKGQHGGVGADGVENDCPKCENGMVRATSPSREADKCNGCEGDCDSCPLDEKRAALAQQAASQVPKIKTWQERANEALGDHWRGYKPDSYMEAEIADLRAALARAPLPAQGDGKKCQYPNCGCTSRTTCNFNYDAAPAQAPLPATAIAKVVETDIDISVIDAVLPIGTPLYAAPAQAGDARNVLPEYTIDIGVAGDRYYYSFKNAHQLPAEFSWNRLWDVMRAAAMSASQDQREAK